MHSLFWGYVLIFFARVIDMSLATTRMLLLVRGRRLYAASIGFFEVIIYIYALKFVVDRLNDPLSLLVYGLGFATGNYVGSLIEEKMAMGDLTAQVITLNRPLELTKILREMGFGVTTWEGSGREGIRHVLNIILPRRDLCDLMSTVNDWDEHAFITIFDARATKGGVALHRKAK